MNQQPRYVNEVVNTAPPGYREHTFVQDNHEVTVAFPAGSRNPKSGVLLSVLHPPREKNCQFTTNARKRNTDVLSPIITGIMGGATFALGNKLVDKYGSKLLNTKRRRLNATRDFTDADMPAVKAFSDFTGRDPKKIQEYQEQHAREGTYFMIGKLVGLWLMPLEKDSDPNGWPDPSIAWSVGEGVRLASDPTGTQYLFIGGDQNLDDVVDEMDERGEMVYLGTVYGIGYVAQKVFDNFKVQEYDHQFGEQNGKRPHLWYSRDAKRLLLVGGDYFIQGVDAGLGASPGIEN